MTRHINQVSESNRRNFATERLLQDCAAADYQADDDAEQAAYLTEWQRTHPGARRLTVSRLLAWLACALVGITFGVIVVAEMLAPRY